MRFTYISVHFWDPLRKTFSYDQVLELLNTEDDILFDDQNDPEYFPTTFEKK